MRMIAMALSLLLSGSAYAGGLGVLATGGIHTERVFYYSSVSPDGVEYRNLEDYDQFDMTQMIPQGGAGLSLMLGDRDDKITGDGRFYWIMDTPQVDPAKIDTAVDDEAVVAEIRDVPKHTGALLIGLSFGVVGSPSKAQLSVLAHMGSAFITSDHNEFFLVDAGPALTIRTTRQTQLFADVAYQMRFRKSFDHSVTGALGIRYLFD